MESRLPFISHWYPINTDLGLQHCTRYAVQPYAYAMTTLEKDRKATYHYFRMILLASIFVGGCYMSHSHTGWGPPVISWFTNPINYSYISYIYHKPSINHRIQPLLSQLNAIDRPAGSFQASWVCLNFGHPISPHVLEPEHMCIYIYIYI